MNIIFPPCSRSRLRENLWSSPQQKEQSDGPFPPVPRFCSIPPFNSPPSRGATITRSDTTKEKTYSCGRQLRARRTSPRHGGRRLQPSCSCAVELGRQPRRPERWVHRPRRRRPLVAGWRRPGHGGAGAGGLDPEDTQGGEVAVEEGVRKEAGGRRRRHWHHRRRGRDGREAPAVPALGPRGGRRRDAERAPPREHAGGRRHSRREVQAARAASGTVAGSPKGRLPLRHAVQRGDADPALLHAFHEQDGQRRERHGS